LLGIGYTVSIPFAVRSFQRLKNQADRAVSEPPLVEQP
jgi:hypothetical protein